MRTTTHCRGLINPTEEIARDGEVDQVGAKVGMMVDLQQTNNLVGKSQPGRGETRPRWVV